MHVKSRAKRCNKYFCQRHLDNKQTAVKEEDEEPQIGELRKEYVSNYSKTEKTDISFTDPDGRKIHVLTNYRCLFDNAIVVPKQYVWEDTTKTFTTHNYVQDIQIIIDKDTIFDKTITKADFADKLYPELKKYAVLMYPDFSYDSKKKIFDFGYSISIPITDVGAGWRIQINQKGIVSKTNR